MPLVHSQQHHPPFYLFNGHLQTIVPALFRRVAKPAYKRERVETPDSDFLDLDWLYRQSGTLVILSHGLEGDSQRTYISGMAGTMAAAGFDVLAWNYRSCSGEPNRLSRFYHMGASDDLAFVINHALETGRYQTIFLVGFSAGGNITLKYLGENPAAVPAAVKRAVAFSVPCDLSSSTLHFEKRSNRIYLNRFLKSLRHKIRSKAHLLPAHYQLHDLDQLLTFRQFDDRFTAPLHGFKNAEDYYQKSSSRQFLPDIQVPTLLVNALNDPFLSPECYPVAEAEQNPNFFLEMPRSGGHVGFSEHKNRYYSEIRALQFLTAAIPQ